jgi:hypothetical protein
VLSVNLHRRHLTASQKAAIAIEATEIEEAEREAAKKRMKAGTNAGAGGRGKTLPKELGRVAHAGETDERLAEQFDTNREYVREARKLEHGSPELIAAVRGGEVKFGFTSGVLLHDQ